MVRLQVSEISVRLLILGEDCEDDEDGDKVSNIRDLCPKDRHIKNKKVSNLFLDIF